ncbi:sigma factor binding protein 1, chloroplastic-like [Mercurialis annua]|uniref:sigma factor binding protein 1, chloroplastic-like n=1 Tax=Mercurialis annua TaxID=3986 RepID=UPI00215EB903|nr:sigma factor binding protein 1, chloroplastic-like [Mercurialis annua]
MDVLGVNLKSKKLSKRSKKGIKVVYISSPMKVETSASKFRALVQELTGKDSDAARFMDTNSGSAEKLSAERNIRVSDEEQGPVVLPFMNSCNDSSSSHGSDSNIFESFDEDRFLSPVDGSFMSMFQSNFPIESFELDFFN